jgi:hypothetical protein
MNIASVGSTPAMAQMSKTPEASESPSVPDHDGDSDDTSVAGPTASATAPGVGNNIDIAA